MAVEQDGRVVAGRYRLTRAIGRGGMGAVWAAVDRRLGHEVAIKELLLNPGMSDDQSSTLLQRALREGRIAATLKHPAVVPVYDTFMADDRPWIVMELLRGRSLAQLISDAGPMPPERAAAMGVKLLSALRAAHEAGIVHRDVKPGNVLLSDDGRVMLTDFGLAAVEGDPSLTQAGMVMGSPPYVAPERAKGAPATPAADLWSLGATLFMAVEGKGPYDRETPIAALGALVTEEPPAARNAGPLRPLIEGLLTRDPRHRLDAETAAELLRRVAEGRNSPHTPPRGQPAVYPAAAHEMPSPPKTRAFPASKGIHAAPEGAPKPLRKRAAAWIGRHRAPAKLTVLTTAVALIAGVASWQLSRGETDTVARSPRPSPTPTQPEPLTPSSHHDVEAHDVHATPVANSTTPSAHRRTGHHRHHKPGVSAADPLSPRPSRTPRTTPKAKPTHPTHPTLLREPRHAPAVSPAATPGT